MAERIFVNVVGFADEERHALNLLFRISEEHEVAFSLWDPGAPQPARLALIDGQSYEARLEVESPRSAQVPVIWVGDDAPARVVRRFTRPISWPEVVQAMDELFPPAVDLDFGIDNADTQPPDTLPPDMPRPKRVLIAAAGLDERLYLRAKLSLADLTQADDATTASEALELARMNDYVLAIVDFDLPGSNGWDFLRELAAGQRPIGKMIVTANRPTLIERVRARFSGVAGYFDKPLHPGKLHEILLEV
ncbi:MAG TPA: response regulator [Ramlibacter sp.]|nr:response regulator [Ramlibacter sp.]